MKLSRIVLLDCACASLLIACASVPNDRYDVSDIRKTVQWCANPANRNRDAQTQEDCDRFSEGLQNYKGGQYVEVRPSAAETKRWNDTSSSALSQGIGQGLGAVASGVAAGSSSSSSYSYAAPPPPPPPAATNFGTPHDAGVNGNFSTGTSQQARRTGYPALQYANCLRSTTNGVTGYSLANTCNVALHVWYLGPLGGNPQSEGSVAIGANATQAIGWKATAIKAACLARDAYNDNFDRASDTCGGT